MNCCICRHDTDHQTCARCATRTKHYLTKIHEYRSEAELTPGRSGEGRSTERPLGVRINALDAIGAFEYVTVLESWEIDWRQHFGLTPYGEASASRNRGTQPHHAITGIIQFLTSWIDEAAQKHPAFAEFHHETKSLYEHAKQAANDRSPNVWRVTCPTDTADGECGRTLAVSGDDFDGSVHCRQCNTDWPVERLLRVVASSRMSELWLDPEAAAKYCGVTSRWLRALSKKGLIRKQRGRYEVHSIRNAMEGIK